MDTLLKDSLASRAAELIGTAFEAGYDDASEVAYTRGFGDGVEYAQRNFETEKEAATSDAVRSVLDTVALNTTFTVEDEMCSCPDYLGETEEPTISDVVESIGEIDDALAEAEDDIDDIKDRLNAWAPGIDEKLALISEALAPFVSVVTQTLSALNERIELLEADAVIVNSLEARLADVEALTTKPNQEDIGENVYVDGAPYPFCTGTDCNCGK